MRKIGIISDTHGLIRGEVKSVFRDCEFIIHAGDIGGPDVLEELRRVKNVFAVRGNVDSQGWAPDLSVLTCR